MNPAELIGGVPILVARFADASEFRTSFAPDRGSAGELAVRTRASAPSGTALVIEIDWPELPNRVFVRAHAHRRWFGGNLVLRFDDDEAAKRDYLERVASGHPGTLHLREHRRYCVRLPLQWRRFGDAALHAGVAEDLSAGGLLIWTKTATVVVGDRVAVRLRAEEIAQDLVLTGVVRHRHRRPSGGDLFGVMFEYRSSGEQRSLRGLLRVFGGRGVVLVDPTL